MRSSPHPIIGFMACWLTAVMVSGCASSRDPLFTASPSQGSPNRLNPVLALRNDQPITLSTVQDRLLAIAGGRALRELILDRELASRTTPPSDADIEREARLLALDPPAGDAGYPLDLFGNADASGERALRSSLDRNARLRSLVAPSITISEDDVRLGHLLRHGPRCRVRVIVLADTARARTVRAALAAQAVESETDAGQRISEAAVIDAALNHGIDDGASRGGLIRAMSIHDPGVPAAIRDATDSLAVGAISPVLVLERGAALVWLAERIPADSVSLESARPEIERSIRARSEHRAMRAQARRLLHVERTDILSPLIDPRWDR